MSFKICGVFHIKLFIRLKTNLKGTFRYFFSESDRSNLGKHRSLIAIFDLKPRSKDSYIQGDHER